MSLVSLLAELESHDEEMNKEASEMQKLAAEEDAAGRITARGFMDELQKLAADKSPTSMPVDKYRPVGISGGKVTKAPDPKGDTQLSKDYARFNPMKRKSSGGSKSKKLDFAGGVGTMPRSSKKRLVRSTPYTPPPSYKKLYGRAKQQVFDEKLRDAKLTAEKKRIERKHRSPANIPGRVGSSVRDSLGAYGKTLSQFGRGLKKNISGE